MTVGATAELHLNGTGSCRVPPETRWCYVTRNIPAAHLESVRYDSERIPRAGDVVLGRVTAIGRHTQIELRSGRKLRLVEGDLLGLVCGNRYATDQFEGYVAKVLGPADLLSVGGTCGEVVSRSVECPEPTTVELLGYVYSGSVPVSLRNYGLSPVPVTERDAKVVLVTGNSMNAGKTTTAVNVILGLVRQGYKVAAGKVTGTGCGNDPFQLVDAGAAPVLDFVSAGYESTYMCSDEELLRIYDTVMSNLLADSPDFVVIEVADGLLQQETASLLGSVDLRRIDYVVHSVADPLSVKGAVERLRQMGYNAIALSGILTSRPLMMKEIASETNLPVFTAEQLAEGCVRDLIGYAGVEAPRAISAA